MLVLLYLFLAVCGYGIAVWVMDRRCALPEPDVEWVELELSQPGHHVRLYRHVPEVLRYREPIVMCHGLGANRFNLDFTDDGRGSDRLSLARALCRAGFVVWVVELRGRGHAKVPANASWSAAQEVEDEVTTAIETAVASSTAERAFWLGHSWGGILGYLATEGPIGQKLAGIVTISSPATLRHHRLPPVSPSGVIPLRMISKLGLPIAGLIRFVGRPFLADLAAIDTPVLRRIFGSLVDDVYAGPLTSAVGWLVEGDYLKRGFDKPALLLVGTHDRICPVAAVSHLAEHATHPDVTMRVMGQATGCSSDYGHGSILLGRHAPDEVFPLIRGWLAARATRVVKQEPHPKSDNGASRTDEWN